MTCLRSRFCWSSFVYLSFTEISQISIGIGICPTFVLLFDNLSYKCPTIKAIFVLPVLLFDIKLSYFPTYWTLKVAGRYVIINFTKDVLNLVGYVDSWPCCTSLKLHASPLRGGGWRYYAYNKKTGSSSELPYYQKLTWVLN